MLCSSANATHWGFVGAEELWVLAYEIEPHPLLDGEGHLGLLLAWKVNIPFGSVGRQDTSWGFLEGTARPLLRQPSFDIDNLSKYLYLHDLPSGKSFVEATVWGNSGNVCFLPPIHLGFRAGYGAETVLIMLAKDVIMGINKGNSFGHGFLTLGVTTTLHFFMARCGGGWSPEIFLLSHAVSI